MQVRKLQHPNIVAALKHATVINQVPSDFQCCLRRPVATSAFGLNLPCGKKVSRCLAAPADHSSRAAVCPCSTAGRRHKDTWQIQSQESLQTRFVHSSRAAVCLAQNRMGTCEPAAGVTAAVSAAAAAAAPAAAPAAAARSSLPLPAPRVSPAPEARPPAQATYLEVSPQVRPR